MFVCGKGMEKKKKIKKIKTTELRAYSCVSHVPAVFLPNYYLIIFAYNRMGGYATQRVNTIFEGSSIMRGYCTENNFHSLGHDLSI